MQLNRQRYIDRRASWVARTRASTELAAMGVSVAVAIVVGLISSFVQSLGTLRHS